MSRKDPRRAIAIALPRQVLTMLRARQKNSRGRRLMDTLRVSLEQALAPPAPTVVPCPPAPPGTAIHLLQLPRALRARLVAFSQVNEMSEAVAICALVLGLGTSHAGQDDSDDTDGDSPQRRMG